MATPRFSLLFFENATQKTLLPPNKEVLHLSLRVCGACVRAHILALSRVLFSSFGGAVLSHRFFRVVVVAREAAGGRSASRDDTFYWQLCQTGKKESRLVAGQFADLATTQGNNKTRGGVWWVFVFSTIVSFCDAEDACTGGLCGRDRVVFFRW